MGRCELAGQKAGCTHVGEMLDGVTVYEVYREDVRGFSILWYNEGKNGESIRSEMLFKGFGSWELIVDPLWLSRQSYAQIDLQFVRELINRRLLKCSVSGTKHVQIPCVSIVQVY